ncbi:neurophysin 1-like [Neodiprion fabricii]|uniref:neurophysin 1-like n=1 Tax=Neodiprion fabricii TaxID=2872261 RepID=UPI001ED909C2|nr:neurophysin 1-like [Neodiprion fabricii]
MFRKIVVILFLVSSTLGCLIINCPRGGKRDGGFNPFKYQVRECSACGPDRQGQCFGPKICCGPSIGCFFGTAETHKCRKESLYSRPCTAGFAMCRGNTGRCAANGICCSQESCYVDPNCKVRSDIIQMSKQATSFDMDKIYSESNSLNDE